MFNSDFESKLANVAKLKFKKIVLPEAENSADVFEAGLMIAEAGIAKIVFLVSEDNSLKKYGFEHHDNIEVINIYTNSIRSLVIDEYYNKRMSKGISKKDAEIQINNMVYFATTMLSLDYVDGMVCGAITTTGETLKPALQIIKGKKSGGIISTFMIMIGENKELGENGIFVMSDCGLNINPNEDELVKIVYDTVESAKSILEFNPKVALLSYSTKGSAEGDDAIKMRNVNEKINLDNPNFIVDGEYQFDAAVVPNVALKKAKNGKLKGDANILIFPNLSSANISYKIMQRFAGFKVIGPLCQGLKKPVNDVSRGADAKEIAMAIIITCIQAK